MRVQLSHGAASAARTILSWNTGTDHPRWRPLSVRVLKNAFYATKSEIRELIDSGVISFQKKQGQELAVVPGPNMDLIS